MKILSFLSAVMIPLVCIYVIGYGLFQKKDCYEIFTRGARGGLKTAVQILPTLIGLLTAVAVLRSSGLLDWLGKGIGQLTEHVGLPGELVPLILVRTFSYSAAVGLLTDLYARFGTDSTIGYTASLLMCCTETVFYTMSLYLLHVGIKKSRYILPGARVSMAAGILVSVWLAAIR